MPKIWLDITNSPHVVFYNPIIKRMKERGYDIAVTAREYAQTKGLLELFGIDHVMIGHHRGKNKFKKLIGLIERSGDLYRFAKDKKFDAAISMGSHDMMVAARRLGIPHMDLFDYEYSQGHHISFRLSSLILSPEGVPRELLNKMGAGDKVVFFPGLKEQFYIHYYMDQYQRKYGDQVNPLKEMLGIGEDRVVIVMRPEATQAHYQTNQNSLSFDLIDYLDNHDMKPVIVILPRVSSQRKQYVEKKYKNVIIPEKVVNGIELIASCDLVIGAGGTINREAAAVGTPVYTIYQGGKICAVDRRLISEGRMVRIESSDEFPLIDVRKRSMPPGCVGEDLSELYLNMVDKLINTGKKSTKHY